MRVNALRHLSGKFGFRLEGRALIETNRLPHYDDSDNPTGCCPRFKPDGWDGQELHFEDKAFVRATTRGAMHVPLNMAPVFERVQSKMVETGAYDPENAIVLSRDLSPWRAEHLFSVSAAVPDEEAVTLSGDFVTKVFKGPIERRKTGMQKCKPRSARRARRETKSTPSTLLALSTRKCTARTTSSVSREPADALRQWEGEGSRNVRRARYA